MNPSINNPSNEVELEAIKTNLELRLKNGIENGWVGGFETEFLVEGIMARFEAYLHQEQTKLLEKLLTEAKTSIYAKEFDIINGEAIPTSVIEQHLEELKGGK